MAGIGFELQRMMIDGGGLMNRIRGYACAGLISSGPWLMTIFTLGILSAFGNLLAPRHEFEVFRGLVTYAFAFSLILVGVLQMTVTRRTADMLYTKQHIGVLPAFAACMFVTAAVQTAIGALFCLAAGLPLGLSFLAVSLYVIVSITWLSLIWLGITREYETVLRGYALGSVVVFLLIGAQGRPMDAHGLLAAYTAGQGVILLFPLRAVARGLHSTGDRDFRVLTSLKEFPRLMLVGLAYNCAIWIDKMIFWFTDGVGAHPWILFHPLYDTVCFLAYLTVIPALAVNLVKVETAFYECYRSYFGAILGGKPLKIIDERREGLFESMRQGMSRLIRIQGAITTMAIIFAPYFLEALNLPETSVRIFRVVCIGAFFHVMLLITILMQLYFDLRNQALGTTLLFFTTNCLFALWSVLAGVSTYGFGYALSGLISLLAAYVMLTRALRNLDYYIFTSQPISAEKPPKTSDFSATE